MPITTTIAAGSRLEAPGTAQASKKGTLAHQGSRLLSWKAVLVQSLGRELHALHIQQQERAFMATSHGLNYVSWRPEASAVH